ncbi:MAG: bifunctional folylpolyglutamate synthase/dihydrofolate synthase [Clostridiales bacterium]|nr:bifunctional folylpolyglutamate synthase/dihydrofolate synthase [Clostridiales bacterium]
MSEEFQPAIDFLYDLPRFTKKNSLAHTARLMARLGKPCYDKRVIHVAGSNGKGSVCCFLYNMLLADGHTAGLFTSPHLVDIRERFQANGELVGEGEFLLAFRRVKEAADRMAKAGDTYPTFFEMVYAMAMLIFEEEKVEYIVLETGLGGRLDATNSFPAPILSVITSISLEHTEILGDTIEQIAAEKAGIIKPGVPVVYIGTAADGFPDMKTDTSDDGAQGRSASAHAASEMPRSIAARVIASRAAELDAPAIPVDLSPASLTISEIRPNCIDFSYVSYYDNCDCDKSWHVSGCALYQAKNAALAIEAMRTLGIMDDGAIQTGLYAAHWPGRMEEVASGIYFDGAHNPDGMRVFMESVRALTAKDTQPPLLLFSMVREKDIEESVKILTEGFSWSAIIVTAIPEERGAAVERLAEAFRSAGAGTDAAGTPNVIMAGTGADAEAQLHIIPDPEDALMTAVGKRKPAQKLFAAGSLHFIGDLMTLLQAAEKP